LPSGDYGFEAIDPMGVKNEIWPVSSVTGLTTAEHTSSTTPVGLTGSPTLGVYLGASGDALVTVAVQLSTAASGEGVVNLLIDGISMGGWLDFSSTAATTTEQTSVARLRDIGATQSPNTDHTFSLQYYTNGTSTGFVDATIIVQPL
jgi:hypothetical protein